MIAQDPDDGQARYARIQCTDDPEQKLRDVTELAEREPAVHGWHRMRARMLMGFKRDLETARADLDFLVRQGAQRLEETRLERAGVSLTLGDVEGALADLDAIEKMEPTSDVAAKARELRRQIEKRH